MKIPKEKEIIVKIIDDDELAQKNKAINELTSLISSKHQQIFNRKKAQSKNYVVLTKENVKSNPEFYFFENKIDAINFFKQKPLSVIDYRFTQDMQFML